MIRISIAEEQKPSLWSETEQKVWEETQENVRQFNRLMAQTRVLGKTIIVSFMAVAAAFTTQENGHLWAGAIQVFVLLLLIGIWILDSYYWSLLIAAVEYARALERRSGLPSVKVKKIEACGLTDYISKKVKGNKARKKATAFYWILLAIQIVLACVYFFIWFSGR